MMGFERSRETKECWEIVQYMQQRDGESWPQDRANKTNLRMKGGTSSPPGGMRVRKRYRHLPCAELEDVSTRREDYQSCAAIRYAVRLLRQTVRRLGRPGVHGVHLLDVWVRRKTDFMGALLGTRLGTEVRSGRGP